MTMTLRCCAVCGEPAEASRCAEHRRADTRTGRGVGHANDDAVFRAISVRLRRLCPFCQFCGARDDLTVDHIIPTSQRPDLAREVQNMRVLCRGCNSRRGAVCSQAEAAEVLRAIAARAQRRAGGSVSGSPVRSLTAHTGADNPPPRCPPPPSPRQNPRYTPGGVS